MQLIALDFDVFTAVAVAFQEQSGSEDQSQKGFNQQQVTGAEGQNGEAEIPWRQVAGLLHSQGITDPQGLVSSLQH